MKLSNHYYRIAIFNTPVQEDIQYDFQGGMYRSEFNVGPFLYGIYFVPIGKSSADVEFELIDIEATDEELVQIISQIEKRPVSLGEARYIERQILDTNSHGLLNLGGTYSLKIFGTVLRIIQNYVQKNKVKCIHFTSASPGRTDLYSRMMKRAFPQATVHLKSLGGQGTDFRVCFGG
jgi:hypothetical protein